MIRRSFFQVLSGLFLPLPVPSLGRHYLPFSPGPLPFWRRWPAPRPLPLPLRVCYRPDTRYRSHGIPTLQGSNHYAGTRFDPNTCRADFPIPVRLQVPACDRPGVATGMAPDSPPGNP